MLKYQTQKGSFEPISQDGLKRGYCEGLIFPIWLIMEQSAIKEEEIISNDLLWKKADIKEVLSLASIFVLR